MIRRFLLAFAMILIAGCLDSNEVSSQVDSAKASERPTCRLNMALLAREVQAAKMNTRATDYSGFLGAPNAASLGSVPTCPSGGDYSIETAGSGFRVRCSIHGTYEPGVDSQ